MKIPIKHKQLCCESVKRITIKEVISSFWMLNDLMSLILRITCWDCYGTQVLITLISGFDTSSFRHPNIIRSRGICVQRTSTYWQLNLLIDFCDRGSLQQHIIVILIWLCLTYICWINTKNDNKPLSWPQRCYISRDVSNALRFGIYF